MPKNYKSPFSKTKGKVSKHRFQDRELGEAIGLAMFGMLAAFLKAATRKDVPTAGGIENVQDVDAEVVDTKIKE